MAKQPRCEACREALVPHTIEARGAYETYAATLKGLPILRCRKGHERREAYEEFMFEMGERLSLQDTLFTTRTGLLRRRDVCRSCGAELNLSALASQRMEVELQHGDAPAYRVAVTAPLVECGECGARQVPNRDEHHLGVSSAIRDALDTEDIRYHGRA